MPLEQSEAIILRTFPIGEQDKIVSFFSRQKGLLKGVAKGSRKFGNRFGSSLEPFSHIEIYFYEKERKELVTISNCDLLESFIDIQRDLKVSLTLTYFSELVEEFFPSMAKNEILFRLFLSTLQTLRKGGDPETAAVYFEAWLLKIAGLLPDMKNCIKCHKPITASGWLSPRKDGAFCNACAGMKKESVIPETDSFLKWVRKHPQPLEKDFPFTARQVKAIHKTLQTIIIYHMEKVPKSLSYMKNES